MGVVIFFLLSLLSVGSVLAMIFIKNQAYNALLLVLAFVSLGGLFGLLDAPFVAAVQILIYAGAIMVLFLFVIMMINLKHGLAAEKKKHAFIIGIVLAAFLLLELFLAWKRAFSSIERPTKEALGGPAGLGRLLFTDYLYAFEITSILIIAALVGSIVLGKKKGRE